MDLTTVTVDPTKTINSRQSIASFVDGAGVRQVETATAAGSITTSGNIAVTVTAAGVTGSPITLNVAALNGDTAAAWAQKVRIAIAANAAISAVYGVSAALDATITLTRINPAANDGTLNIGLADGTSVGVTTAASSTNTTAGSAAGSTTSLLVQLVDFDGSLDLGRMMMPGAANGPAFTARIWDKSRTEVLKLKTKEVKKVITLLGSLTGKKDGTCTAYIRDVDDLAGKSALLSDAFACTLYRDPATVGFGADASEVTLCFESRKDGAIAWSQDAST